MKIFLVICAVLFTEARLRSKISIRETDTLLEKNYKELYNQYLDHFSKQYEGKKQLRKAFESFKERLFDIIGENPNPKSFVNFNNTLKGQNVKVTGSKYLLTMDSDSSIFRNRQMLEDNQFDREQVKRESFKTLRLYFLEPEAQKIIEEVREGKIDNVREAVNWSHMEPGEKEKVKADDPNKYNKMRLIEIMFPLILQDDLEEYHGTKAPGRLLKLSNKYIKIYSRGEWYKIRSSINYRQKDLSQVLKQGRKCNSCYAYGAVQLLESQLYISHKEYRDQVKLSMQDAVDCSTSGCKNGKVRDVLSLASIKGLKPRENYERVEREHVCPHPHLVSRWKFDMDVFGYGEARISSIIFLLHHGVVSVDFIMPIAIHFSKEKVLVTDKMCRDQLRANPATAGHNVMITGYHIADKNVPDDFSYFRARNTWGDDWGGEGFFRIEIPKLNDDFIPCGMRHPHEIYVLSIKGVELV